MTGTKFRKTSSGFTLTEMLATVLIMSIVMVSIVTGVTVVRTSFQKSKDKANAQVLLSTTVMAFENEMQYAEVIQAGAFSNSPAFRNVNTGVWERIESQEDGIHLVKYNADITSEGTNLTVLSDNLLVSSQTQDGLICIFEGYNYTSGSNAYFTVTGLKVYEEDKYGTADAVVLAELPENYNIRILNGDLTPSAVTLP